jgi:hypothetical protein
MSKVNKQLDEIQAQIEALREQQHNLADTLTRQWDDIQELSRVIDKLREGLVSGNGERAYRQRAKDLADLIQRIDLTFEATGETGSGWGKRHSKLVKVTFHPNVGPRAEFSRPAGVALETAGAWALEYYEVPLP